MKAYEIKDWMSRKIRCKHWSKDQYIYFDNEASRWKHENNIIYGYTYLLFTEDNWEEFHEVRKITLYKYTYESRDIVNQVYWTSQLWEDMKYPSASLLKTETKEILI